MVKTVIHEKDVLGVELSTLKSYHMVCKGSILLPDPMFTSKPDKELWFKMAT